MTQVAASLIRPDALDLVVERFPDDCAFPPPSAGDAIAGVFRLSLEMIARTGRALALATPGGKRALAEAAGASHVTEDVDLLARLSELMHENSPERFVEEDAAFLRILRTEYRTCVRGQRPECWGELLGDGGNGSGECARRTACLAPHGAGPRPRPTSCNSYRAAWGRTALAIDGPTLASPEDLAGRLLDAWPALGLAGDQEAFRRLVEERFAPAAGTGARERSTRGLAVRLCSEFVEACLGELSRRLHLPAEVRYTLLA